MDKQIEYIREDRDGIRQKIIELDRVIFAAMIAIIFVFLGSLLGIDGSKQLQISTVAFAIAIPCLAMSLFGQSLNAIYEFGIKDKSKMILSLLGVLASIVGVAAAFWHLSLFSACIFLCFSFVCFVVVFRYHIRLGIAYEMEVDKQT